MTDTDDDLKQRLRYRAPNSACGTEMRELLVEAADRIDDLEAELATAVLIGLNADKLLARIEALETEIERLRTALSRQTHVSIPEDIGMERWLSDMTQQELWRFPDD